MLPGLRRADAGLAEATLGGFGFDPIGLVLAVAGAITLGLVRVASRVPEVSASRQTFRLGRRALPFGDIDRAVLELDRLDEKRAISLKFSSRRVELFVTLRQGDTLRLDPLTRDQLLAAIELSAVALPVDRYDPKGRFGRSNTPHHLTKDETLAVLRHPPLPGEQLPITPDPSWLRPRPL